MHKYNVPISLTYSNITYTDLEFYRVLSIDPLNLAGFLRGPIG
jgi:hypothetical protein